MGVFEDLINEFGIGKVVIVALIFLFILWMLFSKKGPNTNSYNSEGGGLNGQTNGQPNGNTGRNVQQSQSTQHSAPHTGFGPGHGPGPGTGTGTGPM